MEMREWDDYCVRRNLQDENYLKNHMKLHTEMTTRSHYVSRASLSGQINDKI